MALVFKLSVLGWLYFIQGIPFGIQDKFIPLYLRLHHYNFSRVSLMKGLLLPWLCKGVWAPFIQVCLSPKYWLIVSIFGLSLVSYIGSLLSPHNIYGIAVILLSMNILSALQDIVVDGLSISCLDDSQLGMGNTLQVVIYKIGSLFGGAGLIYLSNYTSWSTAYVALSLIYLITSIATIYLPEMKKSDLRNQGENHNPIEQITSQNENFLTNLTNNSVNISCKKRDNSFYIIVDIFRDVFQNKEMAWLCVYVSIYKMGERGAINNFPLYLLDKGVTPADLAFWNGIVCHSLSILGSLFGGLLLMTRERLISIKVLKTFTIHRFLSILTCYFVVLICSQQSGGEMISNILFFISVLALCYLNFSGGIITTATFTLMMEMSRKLPEKSQATHYSCIASLEVAGKLVFATLSGQLIDSCGISNSFLIFLLLSALPYPLLKMKH